MQKGLRVITLQGAIEKSQILLSFTWLEFLFFGRDDIDRSQERSEKRIQN